MREIIKIEDLRSQISGHIKERRWLDAAEGLEGLLRYLPDNQEVLLQLSYMRSLAGDYRSASSASVRAARRVSQDPEIVSDLLSRLRTFNEIGVLKDFVNKMGKPRFLPIPVLMAIGSQLSYLNLQEEALLYLDEAKRGDPNYPPALLSRAQVLTYLARFDEAADDIMAALRRAPEIASAYPLLSQLKTHNSQDNHVDLIRKQLARPGRKPLEIANLAIALHKELDDLGDSGKAWDALIMANRAKRSTLHYSRAQGTALVDALISSHLRDGSPPPAEQDCEAIPIFVVGMHRSGTTLLEQLLSGSPVVKGIGEIYDFTSAMRWATNHHCHQVIDLEIVLRSISIDYEQVGRRYMSGVRWRLGEERFFTDKLPSNFLNAGFIASALPSARIIHMVRDPLEVCFSNLRELFSSANPFSYEMGELAAWFIDYRRLMAHWHALFPGRILDVDYGELTRDPETVMRRVAAFCGIDYVPGMRDPRSSTRAVATASAVQVREGVVRRETPKWAPYARQLQPLADALRAGGIALPGI